tara:strand:- start:6972 stop:7292 length:321 start_codon:yes stop_codon:yes gene_type:complete
MSKSVAVKYFEYWSNKELLNLSELLHDDCKLEDWNISLNSKAKIIELNKDFFNDNKIKLTINELVEDKDKVWAYISIKINNDKYIDVIDVLTFFEEKIIKIKAFKG